MWGIKGARGRHSNNKKKRTYVTHSASNVYSFMPNDGSTKGKHKRMISMAWLRTLVRIRHRLSRAKTKIALKARHLVLCAAKKQKGKNVSLTHTHIHRIHSTARATKTKKIWYKLFSRFCHKWSTHSDTSPYRSDLDFPYFLLTCHFMYFTSLFQTSRSLLSAIYVPFCCRFTYVWFSTVVIPLCPTIKGDDSVPYYYYYYYSRRSLACECGCKIVAPMVSISPSIPWCRGISEIRNHSHNILTIKKRENST